MQTVDLGVSRRKFVREVAQLRAIESTLIARGWWIMDATFPIVKVAFTAVNMRPRFIPFAVKVDFTDYDVLPLDVTFVDPFEDRELLPQEMLSMLRRRLPPDPSIPTEIASQLPPQEVTLYQFYGERPDLPGFLCLPGTRAYHAHPAHSGDPWELYRHTKEGCLFNLLDIICRYGSAPLNQLGFQVAMQLGQTVVPE